MKKKAEVLNVLGLVDSADQEVVIVAIACMITAYLGILYAFWRRKRARWIVLIFTLVSVFIAPTFALAAVLGAVFSKIDQSKLLNSNKKLGLMMWSVTGGVFVICLTLSDLKIIPLWVAIAITISSMAVNGLVGCFIMWCLLGPTRYVDFIKQAKAEQNEVLVAKELRRRGGRNEGKTKLVTEPAAENQPDAAPERQPEYNRLQTERDLVEGIVRGADQSLDKIKPLLPREKQTARVFLEYLCFFLHLTNRLASNSVFYQEVEEMASTIGPLVIECALKVALRIPEQDAGLALAVAERGYLLQYREINRPFSSRVEKVGLTNSTC